MNKRLLLSLVAAAGLALAAGKTYTVRAVSPENKFVKLGQIVNTHGHNEAEVKSQVALRDFGLLVTMEDAGEILSPIGPRVGWVEIIRTN